MVLCTNGYEENPFKFYWEGAMNTYETGNLLVLNFKIKDDTQAGLYSISAACDENSATYIAENGDLWYTKLRIIETNVPVGKIFSWYEKTPMGTDIKISSHTGYSLDTILEIERITESVEISQGKITVLCGEDMEVKDAYSIELTQNGEEVEINGKITVAIELTQTQRWCSKLKRVCV